MNLTKEELTELLKNAKLAHSEYEEEESPEEKAYIEKDQEQTIRQRRDYLKDQGWADWYSNYMINTQNPVGNVDIDKFHLKNLLEDAEERLGIPENWAEQYADYIYKNTQ